MRDLYCEGKTMALAAYGNPSSFSREFANYGAVGQDGLYDIDPLFTTAILAHTLGPRLFGWPSPTDQQAQLWERINALRESSHEQWPTRDDANIAFAGQRLFESVLLGLARRVQQATHHSRLCLAGGGALNCVANGKLVAAGIFEDVYVVPCCADDGQALGKLYLELHRRQLPVSGLADAYVGPEYSEPEIRSAVSMFLDQHETKFLVRELDTNATATEAAKLIADGNVIGLFRGRSELGPRALGHRSILANPCLASMRARLNAIKGREEFRPIAPMIDLREAVKLFDVSGHHSRFMTFTHTAKAGTRDRLPSAVHVDGSARLQTVASDGDPFLRILLERVATHYGTRAVLNTSFNGKNEPLVETPSDALNSFETLGLDALVLESCIITKAA
ncbi:hypothetical protein GCM10023321_37450 [Pseudonocardia eucalypti]|uniref:Carbamoyltransferase n=2 Tax=Pseudonocardia eucalypti TaxID=648755 RepID=A0ABP9QA44_9PSEU